MNKILVIEDDIKLSSFIKEFIEKYAYNVVLINDFNNIETEFFETKPDLILLDINLPYSDGFQLCRAFRRESDVPIIFISARSSEFEQIRGLEMGADDYIVKPFSFELLLAKIQVSFRRVRGEYNSSNGLLLNKKNFEISVNNNVLELSKKEFQLLNKLVLNEDVIVTRDELLEELWDETFFVDDHTLTVNVTRLRNKLAVLGLGDVIKTKRGLGYIYQSKVSES
ncbi:response regulator transcription factor [Clostridium estertheticum]|uniref:response regulator transcription factor n=1 Tax=Clostridium estertheticum TaxID=238834 RepID=UPI001C0E8160|nr:response regulator transcription factor [Clostridium estertheticum]MBU3218213.1 response regulator transcription factor [Clostridium estertheticum]WAG53899.1 response regulator transcription factor [Clostridium estertheticum]